MDRSGSNLVEKQIDSQDSELSVSSTTISGSLLLKTESVEELAVAAALAAKPLGDDEHATHEHSDAVVENKAQKRPRIWAVGGGKGGVGKSLISANFALKLSQRGKRVVAIDLDLGGANLHTCLGVNPPQVSVGDWVQGRKDSLESILMPTPFPGLVLISGSTDPLKIDLLLRNKIPELFEQIRALDADEVIIDLGAGSHQTTIEFFNNVDEGVLSILPEPTSVENAYRFIKAAYYDRLKKADVSAGIREVIEAGMDPNNVLGIRTPSDLMLIIERMDSEAHATLTKLLSSFTPHIVINQVRTPVDIDVGRAISSVCRRYFGLNVKYSGYLDYDSTVWKAIRNRKPVIKEFPLSPLAGRIDRLTSVLLGEEKGLVG